MSYNVAVIGYGLSAKIFHIPFLEAPTFKLYGIVQRTAKPDDDPQKDFPGVKIWRLSEEMLADSNVDIVIVTTLPESHFALTKAALEAGKHVVVEKPFVPTSQEADVLARTAKETGKLLTVYQNRRWDADFLTLKKLIKDDMLGRIVEFETHFDRHTPENPQTWRQQALPGVGQVYDLGTHLLDQVVHLFGMPERITAFVGNQRTSVIVGGESRGGEDCFTVLLHYGNGLMVTVKAACISPESEQLRFWVRGDKGSYRKYHLDVQEDQLKAGMRPGSDTRSEFGVEPESHYGTLTTITNGTLASSRLPTIRLATYTEYYRVFAKALEGKGEVPVAAEDASKVIKLIEMAKESSRTWQTLKI